MGKHQPALLGGLFIGVLSSLPFVNLANCCCLWVLAGGALVVYLQQQRIPVPVETSDAAIGGLIAGAIGGLILCIVNAVSMELAGPVMVDQFRAGMSKNPQMPPEVAQWMERFFTGRGMMLALFAVVLLVFAVFGMLGSLLGLVFFRKKMPPAPPPQQSPFQPPSVG